MAKSKAQQLREVLKTHPLIETVRAMNDVISIPIAFDTDIGMASLMRSGVKSAVLWPLIEGFVAKFLRQEDSDPWTVV